LRADSIGASAGAKGETGTFTGGSVVGGGYEVLLTGYRGSYEVDGHSGMGNDPYVTL
jgi:hypothetical protein